MRVIDLTHVIRDDMPVYPGTERPTLLPANSYAKDGFRETRLSMHSHTGTHIDPPAHLFPDGLTLDMLPPEQFVGRALVVDCRDLNEGAAITRERLERYGDAAREAEFLLFNTGWDARWGTEDYFGDYPCLSFDAIDFVLEAPRKGIGFDVIGLDPIDDASLPRHRKLLKDRGIINIENLCHLDACGKEPFLFLCLPIKVWNSDGAPARCMAVLD